MLAKFLNISGSDLPYINEFFEVIDDEKFIDELRQGLDYLTLDQIDGNAFISCIFHRINNDVFNEVIANIKNITPCIGATEDVKKQVLLKKETLLAIAQERLDKFSPYFNFIDSHFNNELDQVDIRGRRLTDIIDNVFMLLCAQYEEDFYESQTKGVRK